MEEGIYSGAPESFGGACTRQFAPRVEHDDGLAARPHEALVLEHLEHAAGHLARAADETRQLLSRNFDLHAVGMRHGVRLAAQIHDRVRDAARDVDECEIAELAVRAIEARRKLRRELEHETRAFGSDLTKPRIRHLGDFALRA